VIGCLRGVVLDRTTRGELLLEVGGVGYRLSAPAGTLAAVGPTGSAAFVHVHTHVREDAIVLYGFATRDERNCFETLISTHGIGPAVALAILSTHAPAALRRAVATDDVDALVMVPGIGRKTALRLLVELKSRLDLPLDDSGPGLVALTDGAVPGPRAEVQAALAGLGYGADEVREALRGMDEEDGTEAILRHALRRMALAR
jgi:holliday junction DNA helicase RuvA